MITAADGQAGTYRFVKAYVLCHNNEDRRYWYVDHGAYGADRHDIYIPEAHIVAVKQAKQPRLLLHYTDPYGKRRMIGRYASQREAEEAITGKIYESLNPTISVTK